MAREMSQTDIEKPAPAKPKPTTSYSFKDLSKIVTDATNIRDPKTQSVVLVGLLVVLGVALWYGFSANCMRRRRRRRRSTSPCR
ncbi:uncharacterized protein LOC121729704 [Aricia agestis]|uniref:uncharacterized protein LOC121729704 n=1 Tax=Aricia agestis TaxID=91739 RepID=UPI001C20A367|nr:uncharacterized protein LOC121729704 [Aricia agestis]